MREINAVHFDIECLPNPSPNTTPEQYAIAYLKTANLFNDPIQFFMPGVKDCTKEEFTSVAYGVGLIYGAIMNNLMDGEKLDVSITERAAIFIHNGAAKYADGTGKDTTAAKAVISTKVMLFKWLINLQTSIHMTALMEQIAREKYEEYGIPLELM